MEVNLRLTTIAAASMAQLLTSAAGYASLQVLTPLLPAGVAAQQCSC